MTVLRKITFAFTALVLILGLSTAAMAQQKTTVVRVVVVKTENAAAYAA